MTEVLQILKTENIEYSTNINLSDITYLKTGGIAKLIIYPNTTDQVVSLIQGLKINGVGYKVIGATSNLMFLDDTSYSCLISTSKLTKMELNLEKKEIVGGSGVMMSDLSRFALINSIKGFEGLEGIPGTIGGAVFMNAGAYGYEIKDVLNSIEMVDTDGVLQIIKAKDLGLHYRNSYLREGKINGIVTKCFFNVDLGNQYDIESKMELFHSKRHKYQDFSYPNLGSMFSGSVYREIGKRDKVFKLISMLYFLFNYKFKIFRRESPINRKWINDIIVKRFNLKYDKQPFSNKSINCLVNRGQGTDEMLRYMDDIKRLTYNKIPIENEVIEEF